MRRRTAPRTITCHCKEAPVSIYRHHVYELEQRIIEARKDDGWLDDDAEDFDRFPPTDQERERAMQWLHDYLMPEED